MSFYHVPGFIHSFQYSLMQPPADTWLKACTAGAQQHRAQPETIPNVIIRATVLFLGYYSKATASVHKKDTLVHRTIFWL
jgi:hypothetical protein